MECDQYFPSEPYVALTVDQFVGRSGGPRLSKNWHIASE